MFSNYNVVRLQVSFLERVPHKSLIKVFKLGKVPEKKQQKNSD